MRQPGARVFSKAIVHQAVLCAGLLVLAIFVYAAAALLINMTLGNWDSLRPVFLGADVATCVIISLIYEPLVGRLEAALDRRLFRKDLEYSRLAQGISRRLEQAMGMDEALHFVMQELIRFFGLRHAATYLLQPDQDGRLEVRRVRQIGYPSSARLALDGRDFVAASFADRDSVLLTGHLKDDIDYLESRAHWEKDGTAAREIAVKRAVLAKLAELEVALAFPLRVKSRTIGIITLGPRVSGRPFGERDLRLIELVASQIIASIEQDRLSEGEDSKAEFVTLASHELLMPISAIKGYLSLVLDDGMGKVDEKSRAYLENVYASAGRLSGLVRDMLTASRIEAGRLRLAPERLELGPVAQAALRRMAPDAEAKSLALSWKPPDRLPDVWADRESLGQVLGNLLGNAVKYTASGSVTVSAAPGGDGLVRIDIADTGIGMPGQQQERLFEKFYRVYSTETADVPGTGLGLYISRALVEEMGGTIWVVSKPGEGSTFSFTLPEYRKDEPSKEPEITF